MIKFEHAFFTDLGETLTLQQVVSELTKITGVEFTGTLPGYTVKNLEGYTCREVLGYVASICGGNAHITRDGKFTITTPSEANYSITTDNYFIGDYKREETIYKIGKVSCQVGEEVLIKGDIGTDSMELQFENPWVNEAILTDIYNKLNGFEYLGYTMKWQGDISLDVGDIITITDKKDVVRKHPILSQKFTYTGGLTSEIGAKGENKNKNSFSSSGSTSSKMERVAENVFKKFYAGEAHIGELEARNIKFETASGKILDLQTLLARFISGENAQFLNVTSSNTTIANAVIKDAMLDTISANRINAGVLNSNLVNIQGSNGNLLIRDNTIQISDANRVRVQIGKDAADDYNMYVWDANGNLMFDATGLKDAGIKDKIIRDDMVSDTANISGSKINISSLISEFNKDTNVTLLKGSKVALDTTGQSLELSFNSLKSNVETKDNRNLLRNSDLEKTNTNEFLQYADIAPIIDQYGLVEYTISFDLKSKDITNGSTIQVYCQNGSDSKYSIGSHPITVTTEYARYSITFTPTLQNGAETEAYLAFFGTYNTGNIPVVKNVKVERGNAKNPIYSKAPEDLEEQITSNTTSISVVQGQINTLISESTINKGEITTLKDQYTNIEATVNGINSTVASHTTTISNAENRINAAEGSINNLTGQFATVEGNVNNLSGQVTTVESKYSTLEQNLEGFKTTVSSTYINKTELDATNNNLTNLETRIATAETKMTDSAIVSTVRSSESYQNDLNTKANQSDIANTNSTVNGLSSRVSSVEQNITSTAITNTISQGITGGNSAIQTTKFVMDINGLLIKNGGLTIENNAGQKVFYADNDGNATFTGRLQPNDYQIKLFGEECKIDGSANAIRMQWNPETYISVGDPYIRTFNRYSNNGTNYGSIGVNSEGHFTIFGERTMIKLLGNSSNIAIVQARWTSDTAYAAFAGSDFLNRSTIKDKTNVETIEEVDFTKILLENNIFKYKLKTDVESVINRFGLEEEYNSDEVINSSADTKLGFILEELTEEAKELLNPYDEDAISVYSMSSILWRVCQELQKRIDVLESLLESLLENVQ